MCSYNKFPECVDQKDHQWILDQEAQHPELACFRCTNCATVVSVDKLLKPRLSPLSILTHGTRNFDAIESDHLDMTC